MGQSGWLFAPGLQGETASSSLTFLWSKRTTTRRKRPLNRHPCLCVQPLILIPVDTCYFFDAKYKETSDGSLIREHTIKAVFTQRSVFAVFARVTRGGKHGLLQQGYTVASEDDAHMHLSTGVMKL